MAEPFRDRTSAGFSVDSPEWSSARLADEVGLLPDVRHGMRPEHPRDRVNFIIYTSGLPRSAGFDEHLSAIVAWLAPVRARLADRLECRQPVLRRLASGRGEATGRR